jgi:hypothetical protein
MSWCFDSVEKTTMIQTKNGIEKKIDTRNRLKVIPRSLEPDIIYKGRISFRSWKSKPHVIRLETTGGYLLSMRVKTDALPKMKRRIYPIKVKDFHFGEYLLYDERRDSLRFWIHFYRDKIDVHIRDRLLFSI